MCGMTLLCCEYHLPLIAVKQVDVECCMLFLQMDPLTDHLPLRLIFPRQPSQTRHHGRHDPRDPPLPAPQHPVSRSDDRLPSVEQRRVSQVARVWIPPGEAVEGRDADAVAGGRTAGPVDRQWREQQGMFNGRLSDACCTLNRWHQLD